MRITCQTAIDSISDSHMLRDTVGVLSEIKMVYTNLDTSTLYEQVSTLSDSLSEVQGDMNDANIALSQMGTADTFDIDAELESIERELENDSLTNDLPRVPPTQHMSTASLRPTAADPYDVLRETV